jgi:hypothetical protein
MEILESVVRSKPWFLNVPGNQFLVDCLKVVLVGLVVTFIAFIVLVVVFPGLFQGFARSTQDSSSTWTIFKSILENQEALNEWTNILIRAIQNYNGKGFHDS